MDYSYEPIGDGIIPGESLHAGHGYIQGDKTHLDEFFSNENIKAIQDLISEMFSNDYSNKIIIQADSILEYMDFIYSSKFNLVEIMNQDTAEMVYRRTKDELDLKENNSKLDYKKAALFDPSLGLRQHPKIKIREATTNRGFMWNY